MIRTVKTPLPTSNRAKQSQALVTDYLILGFGPAGCITLIELLEILANSSELPKQPISITIVDPNFPHISDEQDLSMEMLRTHGGSGFSDPIDRNTQNLLLINSENLETVPYEDEQVKARKDRMSRVEVRELLNRKLSKVLDDAQKSSNDIVIRVVKGAAIGVQHPTTNMIDCALKNGHEIFFEIETAEGALLIKSKNIFLAIGNVPRPPIFPSLTYPYPKGFFENAYSIDRYVVQQIVQNSSTKPTAAIIGTGDAAVDAFLLLEHYSDGNLTYLVCGPTKLTPFDLPTDYHWSQVKPVVESLNINEAAVNQLNKFINSFGRDKFSLVPKVSLLLDGQQRQKFNDDWLKLAKEELCHAEFMIFQAKLENRICFHDERVVDVRVTTFGDDAPARFEVVGKSQTLTSSLVVFCGGYTENGLLKQEAFHGDTSVDSASKNAIARRCKYWFDVVHPVIADLLALGFLELDELELAMEGIVRTPMLIEVDDCGPVKLHLVGNLSGPTDGWSLRNFRHKIQKRLEAEFNGRR